VRGDNVLKQVLRLRFYLREAVFIDRILRVKIIARALRPYRRGLYNSARFEIVKPNLAVAHRAEPFEVSAGYEVIVLPFLLRQTDQTLYQRNCGSVCGCQTDPSFSGSSVIKR
jgi:hypothetical protein